jgi:hypothetical protein
MNRADEIRELVQIVNDWVAANSPEPLTGEYGDEFACCWIGAAHEATGMSISQIERRLLYSEELQAEEVIAAFDEFADFQATSNWILEQLP